MNKGYPMLSPQGGGCSFRYKYKSNTCQIHMKFNEFNLPEPVNGECGENYLSIISGNAGSFPKVCGDKTGKESKNLLNFQHWIVIL